MSRKNLQVFVIFAVLVALTAGLLVRARHNYQLGTPGIKVAEIPMYGVFEKQTNILSPVSVPLPEAPLDYTSEPVHVSSVESQMLPPDTVYGRRLYRASDGLPMMISVVLMGTDRTSIHKPQYCLTGMGHSIISSEVITIPMTRPHRYDLQVMKLTTASERRTGDEGTRNVLSWMRAHPPRCYIYTSSTSVYAQTDGSVVTEESAAEPRNETSRILRETEELVLGQSHVPAIVLRTSGIYGPGRGHLFQQYLRGETVMRDNGSHYINMVHVEDVAGAIEHCLSNSVPDGLYNLTDDQPVTQRAFFEWLSMRLKKQMPPCAPADAKRKRGVTNKRVSNAKLRSTGCPFIFPSFREGYSEEMRRLGLI